MLKNSPNIKTGTLTVKNDPRILPFGKFLRKSKINELPQLFNVLLGDMSLIGPRPLTIENFNFYSNDTKNIIQKIKPGLSGIGSIIFRNEEEILNNSVSTIKFYKNIISPYKGSIEIWYADNKNIIIYFILILITIWTVLFPRNRLVWKLFPNLPKPSEDLIKILNLKNL